MRKYGPNGIEKRIAWLEWIAERIPRPRLTHWIRCILTLVVSPKVREARGSENSADALQARVALAGEGITAKRGS